MVRLIKKLILKFLKCQCELKDMEIFKLKKFLLVKADICYICGGKAPLGWNYSEQIYQHYCLSCKKWL
jgi:hypothetical protein